MAPQRAWVRFAAVTDAWADEMSNVMALERLIEHREPRSLSRNSIEVRYSIDMSALQSYALDKGMNWETEGALLADLLLPENLDFNKKLESTLRAFPSFRTVCFTNDIEYGAISGLKTIPECVPPTSLLQYVYPQADMETTDESRRWHMTGLGNAHQEAYLPRLFTNTNFCWFFNSNFSRTSTVPRPVRSSFLLATGPDEAEAEYRKRATALVQAADKVIADTGAHPYIRAHIGGDNAENARIDTVASTEGYTSKF